MTQGHHFSFTGWEHRVSLVMPRLHELSFESKKKKKKKSRISENSYGKQFWLSQPEVVPEKCNESSGGLRTVGQKSSRGHWDVQSG